MDKMEKNFDPNIPDTSDGNFFCRLCLIEANSEHMWAIHVAGKRHYRNVIKYPNGLAVRQNVDNDQDYEKPAKYGRFENDEWNACSPKDYENELYTRRNYRPEVKPKVIDYDHKKSLSDVISSPVLEASDAVSSKEKYENPIDQIFEGEKFDQLKKVFEEKIFKAKTGGTEQNTCNSNKVKPNVKKFEYEDDFEKELDELLKNRSDVPESDKDTFSKDKFKRKIENLFGGKLRKSETKDLNIPTSVDCTKGSNEKVNKTKIPDEHSSVKKINDEGKKKFDQDLFKKKNKKNTDDEDFVDIFHKMNDEKLFELSAADEDEDISSVKKSSKTEDPKLDDFDPDSLTTDCLDNLLSSYLKPKAGSSKSKESSESCTKNSSETNAKKDDLDIFARKLESLPTKTFFQIILTRLKNLDLKDSEELNMLLGVISEAQEVVCNKLPPHLRAVIKSKLSQNNSKSTPVSTQYPALPQTQSVNTTTPIISQTVSTQASPTISRPALKSVSKFLSQKEVKSASHPVSSISSQSVQTPVSNTASLIKPPSLNNSDSFQNMIAWQNYLTNAETASEKQALRSANSVEATIAYQNYLSSLQAKALTASKMLSKTTSQNTKSLNTYSNSKQSLSSSSSNSIPSTTQTVSAKKLPSTTNSVHTKDTIKNIFSLLQTASSKTTSQTPSSSLTRSASTYNSSQSQSTSTSCKYVSKKDAQTVSSTAEIPSNTLSYPNQAALQNYQTYYQQLYAMHLQRMTGPNANVGSSPSAFLAALSQNLAASHCNSLPSNSQSDAAK